MNLSLTPQLEIFIRECAESGDYNNASEVVREAVRLLKRTTEERAIKLQHLREAIAEGDTVINRGDSYLFNSEKKLDHFFKENVNERKPGILEGSLSPSFFDELPEDELKVWE